MSSAAKKAAKGPIIRVVFTQVDIIFVNKLLKTLWKMLITQLYLMWKVWIHKIT